MLPSTTMISNLAPTFIFPLPHLHDLSLAISPPLFSVFEILHDDCDPRLPHLLPPIGKLPVWDCETTGSDYSDRVSVNIIIDNSKVHDMLSWRYHGSVLHSGGLSRAYEGQCYTISTCSLIDRFPPFRPSPDRTAGTRHGLTQKTSPNNLHASTLGPEGSKCCL